MRSKKTKFGWVTFVAVLGICLTIGFPIVSHNSPLPLEFRNNSITLVSVSLLLSVVLGYWRFIRNAHSKVWAAIAKKMVGKYIENQMREYSSQIRILGLTSNTGTVNLVLDAGSTNGIRPQMMLDVVTDPGGELFGEVEVVQLEDSRCTVSPINRVSPEFWEKLEDRMKYDTQAPPNVVVKPQIPNGIMEFLESLLQKEKKHDY